jgi:ABC-type transport system involved in multi-copper enzyme maturation permease subunit
MRKILAIAEFTARKIEEPAFIILLIFGAVCGYFVSEMEPFSFGKEYMLIGEMADAGTIPLLGGFLLITMISMLLAGFYGATDIPREIENGSIMIILGKPVLRTEYLLGKYFGVIFIALLFNLVSSTTLIVAHLFKSGELFPAEILFRQFLVMLVIFPFAALNIMFSCFLSDLGAMILATTYTILSFATGTIPIVSQLIPKSAGIDSWLYLIYYFFPNFYYYLVPVKTSGIVFIALIAYTAALSYVFILIGSLKMRTKDMN